MDNAGIFTLGDVAITAAATYITDWIDGFDGISAITADLKFAYGSGGTSGKAYLQTSLRQATATTDPGIDIACMTFTTASKDVILNLTGLSAVISPVTPTDGALPDDTAIAGVLGDRFRWKIVTVGTYAGSTLLSGRIAAR